MTESPVQPSERLAWNDHVGVALLTMAVTTALGTTLGWLMIRDCSYNHCATLPPAARLLIGLAYTAAASLFLGALMLMAPLRRRSR